MLTLDTILDKYLENLLSINNIKLYKIVNSTKLYIVQSSTLFGKIHSGIGWSVCSGDPASGEGVVILLRS